MMASLLSPSAWTTVAPWPTGEIGSVAALWASLEPTAAMWAPLSSACS